MKRFLYLMQGDAASIRHYAYLASRENADAIFLTYDEPLDGALYAPDTLWGQGRNRMLEAALEKGDYMYYIFCDNDIEFIKGGWDAFEQALLRLQPAIGLPIVSPKTRPIAVACLPWQACLLNDEQLIAVHQAAVKDRIVVPYQDQLDRYHYWGTGLCQQILIKNFYFYSTVQFNDIWVGNDGKTSHPDPLEGRDLAKKKAREWCATEFKKKYKRDLEHLRYPMIRGSFMLKIIQKVVFRRRLLLQILAIWHTAVLKLRRMCRFGTTSHALDERTVRKLLAPDSKLLQRYLARGSPARPVQ